MFLAPLMEPLNSFHDCASPDLDPRLPKETPKLEAWFHKKIKHQQMLVVILLTHVRVFGAGHK